MVSTEQGAAWMVQRECRRNADWGIVNVPFRQGMSAGPTGARLDSLSHPPILTNRGGFLGKKRWDPLTPTLSPGAGGEGWGEGVWTLFRGDLKGPATGSKRNVVGKGRGRWISTWEGI